MSCLVYLPRDRYTTPVRLRVQEILRRALNGTSVDYSAQVGESAIAKLHVVLRAERGRRLSDADPARLEREVAAAVRSWDEDLAVEAARVLGAQRGRELVNQLAGAVPATYQTDVPASRSRRILAKSVIAAEAGTSVL